MGQLRKRSTSAFAAIVSRLTLPSFSTVPSLASIRADFYAHSSCVALALWVTAGIMVPEWIYDYIFKLLLPSLVVVGIVTSYMVLNWTAVSATLVPSLSQQVRSVLVGYNTALFSTCRLGQNVVYAFYIAK